MIQRLFNFIRASPDFFRAFRQIGFNAIRQRVRVGRNSSIKVCAGGFARFGINVAIGEDCGIAIIPTRARHGDNKDLPNKGSLVVGSRTSFQQRLSLNCAHGITIGSDCVFSWDVQIMDTDFHQLIEESGEKPDITAPIVIGDKVWVGAKATILKGVTIGDECVIAACSVVTKSFPPRTLIAGVPAKKVRTIGGWQH